MTTSELLTTIEGSILSDSAKQKIRAALAGHTEVTPELESFVKDVIHDDIADDFAEAGISDSMPEMQALDDELAGELDEIESDLSEGMTALESEFTDLDEQRKELAGLEDQVALQEVQESLQ